MIQQPIYKTEVRYNDFWIKIIGSLVASEMIDSIGREESIFKEITHPYFYTDPVGGFIISLILWEIVRFVIRRLDKNITGSITLLRRISLQFLLAIVVPAFYVFVFTLLFMKLAYNQDIFKTEWLYNEFYVVILIIVIINLVYFTWWLFIKGGRVLHGQSLAFSRSKNKRRCGDKQSDPGTLLP